ncbi:cupin domain-containing protein [Nonomuraea sp. NPDC050663]|uniref:cupin domain-containing protein n=1 Tax=Nonomuraea sp. NPDC050663 TaxID=3364370 RepID=UPI0037A311D3
MSDIGTTRPPLAEALDLLPHPEGGWYRETYRSSHTVEAHGGKRSSATAIYFLLMPGERSAPHTVRSDELWLWHRGGPLHLTIGDRTVTLDGNSPQALVPAGVTQSAKPAANQEVLASCVVSPGFDFADFSLE